MGGVRRPAGGDAPRLAAGGLLGVTLYFALENVGVQLATAADAALLVAAYPAITLLLEAAIFRTPVANVRLAGAGVALLGVYLIVGGGLGASGERRLLGDLLLVASGVTWAFYSFVTRTAVRGPYPLPCFVFWQTLTGAVAFLPLAWTERDRWQAPAPGPVLAVVYLGIFCSVVAFLLYARGLRGLDAGGAVALMNLVPFLGLGLAVFVLREPVTVVQVAGGLVVLVGVGLGVHQHSGGGPATRGGGG
jgi:drug/metabolite transporter (DMT)-like permease